MDEEQASEQIKEVFAYFGRAYYCAGVVETGLAMVLLFADFLAKTKHNYGSAGRQHFNREKFEADFDAFMSNQHAQVMGSLANRVNASMALSERLKALISEANTRRNFLAHHYFRERAVEFATYKGRTEMIVELNEAAEFFDAVDEELKIEMEAALQRLGVDPAVVDNFVRNYIAEAEARP